MFNFEYFCIRHSMKAFDWHIFDPLDFGWEGTERAYDAEGELPTADASTKSTKYTNSKNWRILYFRGDNGLIFE